VGRQRQGEVAGAGCDVEDHVAGPRLGDLERLVEPLLAGVVAGGHIICRDRGEHLPDVIAHIGETRIMQKAVARWSGQKVKFEIRANSGHNSAVDEPLVFGDDEAMRPT